MLANSRRMACAERESTLKFKKKLESKINFYIEISGAHMLAKLIKMHAQTENFEVLEEFLQFLLFSNNKNE